MKKIRQIVILFFVFFCATKIAAQEHNMGGNFNCKLKKGNFFNMEKHPCPACEKNDKKEKEAIALEQKRKFDKIWADAKAKKEADDKAYKDKIDKENAEKKRKEKQAIADKKASDELRKKYQEIINKGLVKSDIKGEVSNVELKNIECFKDKDRKVYGFKFEGKEVATFPFIEDYNGIYRIEKTNFFEVRVYKNGDNYSGTYKYSIIIDHLGNKIEIDGKNKFIKIEKDTKNNVISVYTSNSSPEYVDEVICMQCGGFENFYNNRESVQAAAKRQNQSVGYKTAYYIQYVNRYSLDYNLKIINKEIGWILSSGGTI